LISTVVVVLLLFSYRTSTGGSSVAIGAPGPRGAQAPGVVGAGPSAAAARATVAPHPSRSGTAKAGGTTLVNGTVAQTEWGPVQVQVSLAGGRIMDVVPLVYPTGSGRDQSINAYALPRLRQQVLSAQSAQIDGVSGATVTSDGYRESLQAALDAAHFGG
jgi:uncharacterized protein with FMN-binding domain